MINHLKGKLVEKSPTHCVVECSGVGYYVQISLNTFSALGKDENVMVLTHQVIRDDAHLLFGFMSEDERSVFRLLISVSGVGASTGQMILSSLNPDEVKSAITAGDSALFKSVKGIGAKTAQRIIIDLQDKIDKVEGGEEKVSPLGNSLKNEALTALSSLGFDQKKAGKVLDQLLQTEPTISEVEELIKQALKRL
ncbi:Holliday junction branch migration protein RuvA [Halocola ammonii]